MGKKGQVKEISKTMHRQPTMKIKSQDLLLLNLLSLLLLV